MTHRTWPRLATLRAGPDSQACGILLHPFPSSRWHRNSRNQDPPARTNDDRETEWSALVALVARPRCERSETDRQCRQSQPYARGAGTIGRSALHRRRRDKSRRVRASSQIGLRAARHHCRRTRRPTAVARATARPAATFHSPHHAHRLPRFQCRAPMQDVAGHRRIR